MEKSTQNKVFEKKIEDCPICSTGADPEFNNMQWQIQKGSRFFQYASCKICNILFCSPMPNNEELRLIYSSCYDFEWFKRNRILKKIQASYRYKRIKDIFEKIKSWLKPEGFCLIAVPNRESISLAKLWGWLQAPYVHVFCYSLDGIKKVAPEGLKIVYASFKRYMGPPVC